MSEITVSDGEQQRDSGEKEADVNADRVAIQNALLALSTLYREANKSIADLQSGKCLWATFVRDTAWKGLERLLSEHVTKSEGGSGLPKAKSVIIRDRIDRYFSVEEGDNDPDAILEWILKVLAESSTASPLLSPSEAKEGTGFGETGSSIKQSPNQ